MLSVRDAAVTQMRPLPAAACNTLNPLRSSVQRNAMCATDGKTPPPSLVTVHWTRHLALTKEIVAWDGPRTERCHRRRDGISGAVLPEVDCVRCVTFAAAAGHENS